MSNKPRVAILGFGATGAFAAKAAYDAGADVTIITMSHGISVPPGSFWLHWIPTDVQHKYKPYFIQIESIGTEQEYFRKQWGVEKTKGRTSSFPHQQMFEVGYNPADILETLVPFEVEKQVVLKPLTTFAINIICDDYDKVFQTFPMQKHISEQPALVPYMAAAGIGKADPSKNLVVYHGDEHNIIVREATLFGNHYLEFPKGMVGDDFDINIAQLLMTINGMQDYQWITLKDLALDTQPVQQDPANKIQLIGRFAEWNRKRLSHETYEQVFKIVREL